MVARIGNGLVPREKADGYAESDRVHILPISFWDSLGAIRAYAGAPISRGPHA
jgi:hypothetical protein